MRIAVYKERIKKTSVCLLCKESFIMSKGNQKYHPWCAFDVKRERENAFNRQKTLQKRYEL